MVLKELKEIVAGIKQADDAAVVVRYTDTMGTVQTAELKEVLLENSLTSAGAAPRCVILVAA